MILPTKHISLKDSYLGVGMTILRALRTPKTAPMLWKAVCQSPNVGNTRRFYKALDLLYMLGAIDITKYKIHRV